MLANLPFSEKDAWTRSLRIKGGQASPPRSWAWALGRYLDMPKFADVMRARFPEMLFIVVFGSVYSYLSPVTTFDLGTLPFSIIGLSFLVTWGILLLVVIFKIGLLNSIMVNGLGGPRIAGIFQNGRRIFSSYFIVSLLLGLAAMILWTPLAFLGKSIQLVSHFDWSIVAIVMMKFFNGWPIASEKRRMALT